MTLDLVRLHITPLGPDLLKAVLGPTLLAQAHNISYHQIQTFPEKNYGYVELPPMEADKVKKKLNGAMLKGTKIEIEEARPKKRKHVETNASGNAPPTELKMKSSKAEKTKPDVLNGRELSPDRKVKRGWTESSKGKKDNKDKKSKGKSDQQKSKYTDKDELLFRTTLPSDKISKSSERETKKKKRNVQNVHEFAKNTAQPSFLRESAPQTTSSLHYVDGEGWANEADEIVEPESKNLRARRSLKTETVQPQPKKGEPSQAQEESDDSSSSSSTPVTPHSVSGGEAAPKEQLEVHPLEALFKKPKKPASSQDTIKPSLELTTSNFSFFEGVEESEDDIEEEYGVPLTPFSSQDLRSRGLRSAAPTPDTAHPSRFNSYGSSGLPGDEEEEDSGSEDDSKTAGPSSQGKPQGLVSDFEKMFWEKRGDNNRAWKARRRAVLKDKRQRENRARRPKNW